MELGTLAAGLAVGGTFGWLWGSRKGSLAAARFQAEAESGRAALAAELARHQAGLKEQSEVLEKTLAVQRDAFKVMSAEALREAHPEFIRQARESFGALQENYKGDMAQRQEAISGMLQPLRQQLETYQQRLQQSDGAQSSALGEVKKQLELLSTQSTLLASETEQFRRVIHSSQARGRWGEENLRRVVEAAGMSPHCDFIEQSQEGDSKPDMLVNLPGARQIIVDAKAPDLQFLDGLEQADAPRRAETLKAHARKIRETVTALAARKYGKAFPSALDYVVMFLPSESLFSTALEADRDLIVWAAQQKVLLATPATLIGLLRAISMSWQQSDQMENAQEIARAAQDLFDRAVVLIGHVQGIGEGLSKASKAYNSVIASYEERLRPVGKRLSDLGLSTAKAELPALPPLDSSLRVLAPPAPVPAEKPGEGTRAN